MFPALLPSFVLGHTLFSTQLVIAKAGRPSSSLLVKQGTHKCTPPRIHRGGLSCSRPTRHRRYEERVRCLTLRHLSTPAVCDTPPPRDPTIGRHPHPHPTVGRMLLFAVGACRSVGSASRLALVSSTTSPCLASMRVRLHICVSHASCRQSDFWVQLISCLVKPTASLSSCRKMATSSMT